MCEISEELRGERLRAVALQVLQRISASGDPVHYRIWFKELVAAGLLIFGRRHLERVLFVYVEHYDSHRPHRSLGQRLPFAQPTATAERVQGEVLRLDRLRRRDRLGGLIHEYRLAA